MMPWQTFGQDSPSSTPIISNDQTSISGAELNRIRAALAELAGRRAEVKALGNVVTAKDRELASLNNIIAQQDQLIAKWKDAAESRAGANGLEDEIRKQYEELTKRYDSEISKLRGERDKAIATGRRNAVLGFIFGAVVTAAVILAARSGGT